MFKLANGSNRRGRQSATRIELEHVEHLVAEQSLLLVPGAVLVAPLLEHSCADVFGVLLRLEVPRSEILSGDISRLRDRPAVLCVRQLENAIPICTARLVRWHTRGKLVRTVLQKQSRLLRLARPSHQNIVVITAAAAAALAAFLLRR